MTKMPKNKAGFTLIELIIVIVILGIMAVTAAPKFINFATDARISALRGLQGAVESSIELIVATAAVEGTTEVGGGLQTLSFQGNTVYLNAASYPVNWALGLQFVVELEENQWEVAALSQSVQFRPLGMTDSEDCYFQYDATDLNEKPTLSIVSDEC